MRMGNWDEFHEGKGEGISRGTYVGRIKKHHKPALKSTHFNLKLSPILGGLSPLRTEELAPKSRIKRLRENEAITVAPGRKKSRVAQTPEEKEAREANSMWVFHANANGYKTHGIDIEAELEIMSKKPELVFLNETKTDKGDPDMTLTGYTLLCRRDRGAKNKGGNRGLRTHCEKFEVQRT